MVAHIYSPAVWEAEAGELGFEGQVTEQDPVSRNR
jgi:hypothetical protein